MRACFQISWAVFVSLHSLRSAVAAKFLMTEDFIESRETNQRVDGHSQSIRDIATDAKTCDLETPVKTPDDEENKRNFMDVHTIN